MPAGRGSQARGARVALFCFGFPWGVLRERDPGFLFFTALGPPLALPGPREDGSGRNSCPGGKPWVWDPFLTGPPSFIDGYEDWLVAQPCRARRLGHTVLVNGHWRWGQKRYRSLVSVVLTMPAA